LGLEAQVKRLTESEASSNDQLQMLSAGTSRYRLCLQPGTYFLAENLSSFSPNNVLITVRNNRLRTEHHLWTHSRFLEGSAYFQGILSDGFVESLGVQDSVDRDEALDEDEHEEDSDDEMDAGLDKQASTRPPAAVIQVCQPQMYHIKTSAHRFSTWRAVLQYCQTGHKTLHFSRLRSLGGVEHSSGIQASPKSVIKLAKYLQMPDLVKLAVDNLISQLTPEHAEQELYTPFCQVHTEVRSAFFLGGRR
jgi:hypothetical protein